jgi:alpha-ketoglutarate-dependent taurine dioxygenase
MIRSESYGAQGVSDRNGFPLTINFDGFDKQQFIQWYHTHKARLDEDLSVTGAILFKGLPIETDKDFQEIMAKISTEFLDYIDGNSPRKKLGSGVYTSTEFDQDYDITLHNELSYSSKYPLRVFFCCLVPSESGGETPLADSRKVYASMDREIIKQLDEVGVMYIRNLHDGSGVSGPSWQDTFETTDPLKVEEYCNASSIKFQWSSGYKNLKLSQLGPGSILHPKTNERVWFNQLDQFHPSHFPAEIYDTLMMIYENKVANLPTYVTLGNNKEVPESWVATIKETVEKNTIARPWNKGDLLMLDNVLVMHGRRPFKGNRRILVSMAETVHVHG